jgi:hypothetical protein
MSISYIETKHLLMVFDTMKSIITRLINIRNSGIKSNEIAKREKEIEELEKENNGLIYKRTILLEAQDAGFNLKSMFDYILNEKKQFEFEFKVNQYPHFSLDQILDVDFYPDAENYPRGVHEYRTIKSAPKEGNISPEVIHDAVKVVLSSICDKVIDNERF